LFCWTTATSNVSRIGRLRAANCLARELAELPEPTRRALLARVVEERAYHEIAAELDCSELVVRQRVHRGLSRLRAGLKEER
jgi:RNA polymerase sigma-70 factor (ECF subfamily)